MHHADFWKNSAPVLTAMVQAHTPQRVEELAQKALAGGAQALGMQLCRMQPAYRTQDVYRRLFSLAPTYATNYRLGFNEGKTDDQLADELVEMAQCGASLCDVMTDLFDPQPGEFTMNEQAVEKQRALIDRIHAQGAAVLMSAHVLTFTPAEDVLRMALEQQKRGADVCKIVTGAETMAQQAENLRIIPLLRQELSVPFLFLCGGECSILRRVGEQLGNGLSLCVPEYDELATKSQPLLSDMIAIRKLFAK